MANILIHTGDEPAIVSPDALRRLLNRGDGDAALLYLDLLRHQGKMEPSALTKEMRWEQARMDAAERVLKEIGLITPDIEQPGDAPEPEEQSYQQEEIAFQLERNADFQQLLAQVESRLGKKLSPKALSRLLGLMNNVGLPCDVIYILVNHCAERYAAAHGEGRVPDMAWIERIGVDWYNMGIDTQSAAADYLKRYAKRKSVYADYMRLLNLGDREPGKFEENYLARWAEWDFPPETVALAYEKTLLRCHELKWSYCNKILKDWHESGWRTVSEIEKEDKPEKKRRARKKETGKSEENEVRKYAERLRKKRERKKETESGA